MQRAYKNVKVAVFTDLIQVGGGPMGYVHNMIQGLQKINSGNVKVSFLGYDLTRYPKTHGIIELYRKIQRKIYRFSIVYKKKFCLKQYDICVFQGWQDSKYEFIAKAYSKTCVYMPHSPSIMADEHKMLWELAGVAFDADKYQENYETEKKLFENADYIVFPSRNAADSYFKEWKYIINSKKIIYLKSGVIKRVSGRDNFLQKSYKYKKIIAFCGRYVTHKGFDLFCEVADTFRNNKSIVFICYGDGPLKSIIQNHNVIDMGFTKDMGSVFENVSLITIPNKITYYDLLPLECAAYGKPMVMSAVGGNIDQARDLPDTLTFSSCDIKDFREKIILALNKLDENPSWGELNKTIYEKQFTEVQMMLRWLDLFRKISVENYKE